MSKNIDTAAQLRVLALVIRNNPEAREAIADSIELIAGAMDEPCMDCGHPEMYGLMERLTGSDISISKPPLQKLVINSDDNPATGTDTATTGQAA